MRLQEQHEMIDQWYVDACKTWNQAFHGATSRHAEKTFLVHGDRSLTYAEFAAEVTKFANGLLTLGVAKGDVVAIWMTNRIEWVIAQFAIYRTGAILLPLYSYYRKSELDYALEQAGISTLIVADQFLGKIDALGVLLEVLPELRTAKKGVFSSKRFPALRNLIVHDPVENLPGRHRFQDVISIGNVSDRALLLRESSVSPFDVMNIMYTSGTTGFPKGGMSMHVTNLATTTIWSEIAGLSSDDVILCHVPLFTNFGGLYAAPLGLINGSKVIITEQFDAAESLRLIEKERVTYIPGTPSMFRMLLDHPDLKARDVSSIRGGHVAGAPLTETTMREIIDVLGAHDIMQAWGLSECGGLSTISTREHSTEKRLKSVGRPIKSARIKVVDKDTGEAVPTGEMGEIWLGDVYPGSCVGKGYFRMPDKTTNTITTDGWFRTGDLGYFDDEGFLYISGRVDDMFTVGGFNVYPAEIENKLEALPSVLEAHIVPLPDRRLGHVPVAWIALSDAATISDVDIVQFIKHNMASQKIPRHVFFYKPGDLPMTPAGKVKKKDLAVRTKVLIDAREGSDQPNQVT